MTDDEYLEQRFRDKRPFENDALGLRGPQPITHPMREILGADGGNNSYQVNRTLPAPDPMQLAQTTGNQPGSVGNKQLIVIDNGTANYYNFDAVFVSSV